MEKRITFNQSDACHLYEYLRFYWEEYFLRHPQERRASNKYGSCPACESIGKRLERFIGEKDVRFVERLLTKHRKSYYYAEEEKSNEKKA